MNSQFFWGKERSEAVEVHRFDGEELEDEEDEEVDEEDEVADCDEETYNTVIAFDTAEGMNHDSDESDIEEYSF
ncbi:hypothetical protein V5O48_010205 [Marasmius crinis-equi]|uniref:Uncharacterized protein n=1 Tax=Marasmius crinis-equi TaxID=585013 RepID=A0ABR3F9G3_9AGAR